MSHQHLPTNKILKDAVLDIFKHFWKYIDLKNGTAKCAICGKTISVPENYEQNFHIRSIVLTSTVVIGLGLLLYGVRYLVFLTSGIDYMLSDWSIVYIVLFNILMLLISYAIRIMLICHYLVYNDWEEIDPSCNEQLQEARKKAKDYIAFIHPLLIPVAIYFFTKTLTIPLP